MEDTSIYDEVESRIREVEQFHGGQLPLEHALVWEGYIAALLERQLISSDEYKRLLRLLPTTPEAPSLTIFLGPEGARKLMEGRSNEM